MTTKIPDHWDASRRSARAVQVAFELEHHIAQAIREKAVESGLTPSDQIRKMIGLDYSPPKRPRLTVSLSKEDYAKLADMYGLDPADTVAIKRAIMHALIQEVIE